LRGALVVFLHDFFDSPHVYRDLVFADFWEWACFTIETLQQAQIPFFIKPHPNQIGLSQGALTELQRRFPALPMLSANLTNKQLVSAGMVCGVTVYGSVAHELAYLGVPTVGCARHPHISFDFCRTAATREEYARFLRESVALASDKAMLRRQSLEFYYMHNLDIAEDQRELRDTAWGLFWAYYKAADAGRDLVADCRAVAVMPALALHINRWLAILRS
jgi:hypothetical protein